MLDLVADLARNKGMSVILCSHLLKDVDSVASQIIVLGNGRVLYRRVHEHSDGPQALVYRVRVRGNAAAFAGMAAEAAGVESVGEPDGPNVVVQLAPGTDPAVLFRAAAETGCVVMRLEEAGEKLEDVFVKAMGELGDAHL